MKRVLALTLAQWKQVLYFAICFAALFTLFALANFWFARRQVSAGEESDLRDTIKDLNDLVVSNGRWNLAEYRNSVTSEPSNNLILTDTGQLIDSPAEGEENFLLVTFPNFKNLGGHPSAVVSDAGEKWFLVGRRIQGGFVVLGVTQKNARAVANLTALLGAELRKFGPTLTSARKLRSKNLAYFVEGAAVIADSGVLENIFGGIPLRVRVSSPVLVDDQVHEFRSGHATYAMIERRDSSVTPAADVVAFDDITGQIDAIGDTLRFNLWIAGIAWVLAVAGSAAFITVTEVRRRRQEMPLEEALRQGEGQTVEFKTGLGDKTLAPAVAAFANTNSGNIFVGINDTGVVVGLDAKTPVERDAVQKKVRDVAQQIIDPPVIHIRPTFIDYGGKVVLRIFVPKGDAPIHLVDGVAYIRLLTTVTKADANSLVLIIKRGHSS